MSELDAAAGIGYAGADQRRCKQAGVTDHRLQQQQH